MMTDTITTLPDPHGLSPDPLTDTLRAGARDLIQQAVEAELSVLMEAHSGERTEVVLVFRPVCSHFKMDQSFIQAAILIGSVLLA